MVTDLQHFLHPSESNFENAEGKSEYTKRVVYSSGTSNVDLIESKRINSQSDRNAMYQKQLTQGPTNEKSAEFIINPTQSDLEREDKAQIMMSNQSKETDIIIQGAKAYSPNNALYLKEPKELNFVSFNDDHTQSNKIQTHDSPQNKPRHDFKLAFQEQLKQQQISRQNGQKVLSFQNYSMGDNDSAIANVYLGQNQLLENMPLSYDSNSPRKVMSQNESPLYREDRYIYNPYQQGDQIFYYVPHSNGNMSNIEYSAEFLPQLANQVQYLYHPNPQEFQQQQHIHSNFLTQSPIIGSQRSLNQKATRKTKVKSLKRKSLAMREPSKVAIQVVNYRSKSFVRSRNDEFSNSVLSKRTSKSPKYVKVLNKKEGKKSRRDRESASKLSAKSKRSRSKVIKKKSTRQSEKKKKDEDLVPLYSGPMAFQNGVYQVVILQKPNTQPPSQQNMISQPSNLVTMDANLLSEPFSITQSIHQVGAKENRQTIVQPTFSPGQLQSLSNHFESTINHVMSANVNQRDNIELMMEDGLNDKKIPNLTSNSRDNLPQMCLDLNKVQPPHSYNGIHGLPSQANIDVQKQDEKNDLELNFSHTQTNDQNESIGFNALRLIYDPDTQKLFQQDSSGNLILTDQQFLSQVTQDAQLQRRLKFQTPTFLNSQNLLHNFRGMTSDKVLQHQQHIFKKLIQGKEANFQTEVPTICKQSLENIVPESRVPRRNNYSHAVTTDNRSIQNFTLLEQMSDQKSKKGHSVESNSINMTNIIVPVEDDHAQLRNGEHRASIDRIVNHQGKNNSRFKRKKVKSIDEDLENSSSYDLLPSRKILSPLKSKKRSKSSQLKKKSKKRRRALSLAYVNQQRSIQRLHSNSQMRQKKIQFADCSPRKSDHGKVSQMSFMKYQTPKKRSNSFLASPVVKKMSAALGKVLPSQPFQIYREQLKSFEKAKFQKKLKEYIDNFETKLKNLNTSNKSRISYLKQSLDRERSKSLHLQQELEQLATKTHSQLDKQKTPQKLQPSSIKRKSQQKMNSKFAKQRSKSARRGSSVRKQSASQERKKSAKSRNNQVSEADTWKTLTQRAVDPATINKLDFIYKPEEILQNSHNVNSDYYTVQSSHKKPKGILSNEHRSRFKEVQKQASPVIADTTLGQTLGINLQEGISPASLLSNKDEHNHILISNQNHYSFDNRNQTKSALGFGKTGDVEFTQTTQSSTLWPQEKWTSVTQQFRQNQMDIKRIESILYKNDKNVSKKQKLIQQSESLKYMQVKLNSIQERKQRNRLGTESNADTESNSNSFRHVPTNSVLLDQATLNKVLKISQIDKVSNDHKLVR